MKTNEYKGRGFWILISMASLLVLMLLAGQTLGVFNYDLAVSIGMQESENEIGKIGIAFAKGFGFADTVIYIPLFVIGIIGLLKNKRWGKYTMFGALAISVYWPIVHLYAIYIDMDSITLNPEKYIYYPILLSLIIIYGLWGMRYLYSK
ncbi:MAG: hypothetical protein HKO81_01280 [Flavobacteriaceae bacterium]|nr:hypothetical protein [Flavobacteriaceae bacterium]